MLRRFTRSFVAKALVATGAERVISRRDDRAPTPLILGYHRVLGEGGPAHGVPSMGIRVATLRKHLEHVSRTHRLVSLDDLAKRVDAGDASRFAAVTFDDGYADFRENGFPLLQSLGIPAALFVVTSLLQDGRAFMHDRLYEVLARAERRGDPQTRRALLAPFVEDAAEVPDDSFAATRMLLRCVDQQMLTSLCATLEAEYGDSGRSPRSLSWDDVVSMARSGLTVGSHTHTHALLAREKPARVADETAKSKSELEARLGAPVLHFVYPDGSFDRAAVDAVALAGYRYAYTGCAHQDPARKRLTQPRRVLWEGSSAGLFGEFSAEVMTCVLQGVFDGAATCRDDHENAPFAEAGRRRVAVVAPALDIPGGQSIQAAAIVSGLRADGVAVTFIPTNPRFPRGLRWIRRIPVARTILNLGLYLASLRNLEHADVVHIFSAAYWSFLLGPVPAIVVARVLSKWVVLNYHSGEADDHLRRFGILVHPWLRKAHEIVVPSTYLHGVFERHGYASSVVPNVVDTAQFRYRERAPLRPRFLCTRTLERAYGVHDVLEAFASIKEARPDATLVIAGTGSEDARLRLRAREIPGVTFAGRVPPARVPALCEDADIFLNASRVDNQPLSILEAFACGLPVVTTGTGGIGAMVKDGESGLIVPAGSPEALVRASLRLLQDPALAKAVARGGREVAESHSWSGVRDQWRHVYASDETELEKSRTFDGARVSNAFSPSSSGSFKAAIVARGHRC